MVAVGLQATGHCRGGRGCGPWPKGRQLLFARCHSRQPHPER